MGKKAIEGKRIPNLRELMHSDYEGWIDRTKEELQSALTKDECSGRYMVDKKRLSKNHPYFDLNAKERKKAAQHASVHARFDCFKRVSARDYGYFVVRRAS